MAHTTVFAMTLQEMMDEHKLNQVDIAYALGKSPQYINDVLHGRRDPLRTDQLIRLKHLYHFDSTRLLIARAWSLKKIDIPATASLRQVERAVRGLAMKESDPQLEEVSR